jgi:hypothetical protein
MPREGKPSGGLNNSGQLDFVLVKSRHPFFGMAAI